MPKRPAVFIDRDGVINDMIPHPQTGEYESPHVVEDIKMFGDIYLGLKELQKHYDLFVVSNQPSFAKGKATMEQIHLIAEAIKLDLEKHGVHFKDYFYCYHHPESIVADLKVLCECRKPKSGMLKQADEKYGVDFSNSWMVGDRDIDVECGQGVGCRTILVEYPHSADRQGKSKPTFIVKNLKEACEKILSLKGDER